MTAIANGAACKLSPSEIALAASIFVQLGDNLATITASEALCEEQIKKETVDFNNNH